MIEPFRNLTISQVNKLLKNVQSHIYKYKKGQEILPTIKNENIIAIILNGSAEIINIDYYGNETNFEKLKKNSVFTTNMNAINYSNCQILATSDETEVLVINHNALINENNTKYTYYNIFMQNLFDILNDRYKDTNERIRVLEKKTIRDKLLEYFDIEYKKTYTRVIELPFNLKDLADYLAINRSAMFRELKNLKEDKIISVKGNKITLLTKKPSAF